MGRKCSGPVRAVEKLGSEPCCSGAFPSDVGEAPQPRIWPKLYEGRERDADRDSSESTQTPDPEKFYLQALGERLGEIARLLREIFQE